MKKMFGLYSLGWLVMLGLFNVIVFVTPSEYNGVSKFSPLFWIGYAFITLCFVIQLACTLLAFRKNSLQNLFYNIPLIRVSVSSLIVTFIAGCVCMSIIPIPVWVGIIVCAIALAFTVIALLKALALSSVVSGVDEKVKVKTAFVKFITADAESLSSYAKDPKAKELCGKVFEALKYSDPVSAPELNGVEQAISERFSAFSGAVRTGDTEQAEKISADLLSLIKERAAKCKALK